MVGLGLPRLIPRRVALVATMPSISAGTLCTARRTDGTLLAAGARILRDRSSSANSLLFSPPVRMVGCKRGRYSAITRRSNGEGGDEGNGEAQDEVGGGSECKSLPAQHHDEGECEDEGEDECLQDG